MITVLVVEDEPLIAMALEAELEDAGYAVVLASNGRQALEQLAGARRPDIVLTDMMMPIMNGAQMLAAMAADRELSEIPVVIVSSLPESAIRARVDGAALILRKPYTADAILGAIEQVVGHSSRRAD